MMRAGTAASGSGALLCAEKEACGGYEGGRRVRQWVEGGADVGKGTDDAARGQRGWGAIANAVYAHERDEGNTPVKRMTARRKVK